MMSNKYIVFFSQRGAEQKNTEDILFDMFKSDETDTLPMGKFLAVCIELLL